MKKILILTAGFGEGHNSAARGIQAGLRQVAGEHGVRVEVHDLFADTYGEANDYVRHGYLSVINNAPRIWAAIYRWLDRERTFSGNFKVFFTVKKRFRELLGRFEPDAIVSVYPAYPHMLDEMLGPAGKSSCGKRVVVITDSLSVNGIWYRCSADFFLLPNEQSAAVLHRAGISPSKTLTLGFPVSPEFAEPDGIRFPPSDENGRRVLYLINARRSQATELVHRLSALPEIQLTVAVGRDQRLRKAVARMRPLALHPFRMVGWSEELPRVLRSTHLLISKAGGATVQEAIAAGCPMIVNHVIPGQEEGNARYLVQNNSGTIATSDDAVLRAVRSAFANDAAQWREWSANIAQLSRPAASLDIA
ncbi:MAG TPA: glycosyltransferase, partial [Chthoniobacterales bacterium]|nr:glycosyltransferase [Chthoniobacterales bacterium]